MAPVAATASTAAGPAPERARPGPAGRLRDRLQAWWLQRLPVADTLRLTQRNIYIVPTKAGFAFALTLLLMLVASINYQLNLGYMLTFLLAGSGIVSMHITHGTLRGLTLHLRPAAPVFAGEPAMLEVVIQNPSHERHGLAVRFQDRHASGRKFAWCDVPAGGAETVRISTVPASRGWHGVPVIVVESGFPLGLFRAWSTWRPAGRVLAWPRPEQPVPPLPGTTPLAGEPASAQRRQGSEMDGVRGWRRGDALRQIVWKKVARTGQLVSRETAGSGSQELWLDWADTQTVGRGADGLELRLSRMAAWVLEAERAGVTYGLRLPGREGALGQGDAHRRAALDALATWS